MRMTAIDAQTERKRRDRSARCAENPRCRDRTRRFRGLIRPVSTACATAGAPQGEKRLSRGWFQAIFTSKGMPLGECRFQWGTLRMFRFLAGAILALASGITGANAATVTPFLNGPTEVTAGEVVQYSLGYTVDGISGPYNRVYGSSTLKLDGETQESFPAAAQGFSDTISLIFEEAGE